MECSSEFLDYGQTGYFSKIVTDYIAADEKLRSFYQHPVSYEGIKAAMGERSKFKTGRKLLVAALQDQYATVDTPAVVKNNIESLLSENTFTICTAHQPNIFTGHLYFVYKILHAIKLAADLKKQFPENNFVPVYYMGSEDADLEELGHIYIKGEKYEWKTKQTGAVGRMTVDKDLVKMIDAFSGQLTVNSFGNEIIDLVRNCYTPGVTIEQATFKMVNELFASFGLVVLLPDNALLKAAFAPVIERELLEAFSHPEVEATVSKFPGEYKVQPTGRALNMFYLRDDKRERIERANDEWSVVNTDWKFTKEAVINELKTHAERFSPNVILRPVFQEFILPNIAFVGGGGEIAYWLQLKRVFKALDVPYPVLVVRNSFMLVEEKYTRGIKNLGLQYLDLFKNELDIMNDLVRKNATIKVDLQDEKTKLNDLYQQVGTIAGKTDVTLQQHTQALQTQALKKIAALEKKMLSAERKKMETQQRQVQKLKEYLFPNHSLQERVENMMPMYATWGKGFFQTLYDNSLGLQQKFVILSEK